jgi:XTP/dITP diphosphohydrolase
MNQLVFATNNQHKVEEVKSILNDKIKILSLAEAGIHIDIPEPYHTLKENACEKARAIHKLTKKDCFAEDTGLEVKSLQGEPGVRSARYAGEEKSFENNIDKLLKKLKNKPDSNAQFRTIICLIINGKEILFEGICKGSIIAERRGTSGFGYDAVFVPEGSAKTFAEMTLEEKNHFSHRKKAINKLIDFLRQELAYFI